MHENPSSSPLLEIEGLSKNFGALYAIDHLDLHLDSDGITGLIGPNGAGKTTVFNTVTGIHKPTSGRVLYRGLDITAWPAHRVANLGVARTFQNLKIFKRLTVLDNILGAQTSLPRMASWLGKFRGKAADKTATDAAEHALVMVGLADRQGSLAQELPLGEQRRLELARALAREPDLLMLDEPAGGMTPQETEDMAQLIEKIASSGPSVLLIEHKMSLVMSLCQNIIVLNFGQKIAEGDPGVVQSDPAVREAYLGSERDHA